MTGWNCTYTLEYNIGIIAILLFIVFFCFIRPEPIMKNSGVGFGRHSTKQYIDK
jgi:hypothetical protein